MHWSHIKVTGRSRNLLDAHFFSWIKDCHASLARRVPLMPIKWSISNSFVFNQNPFITDLKQYEGWLSKFAF